MANDVQHKFTNAGNTLLMAVHTKLEGAPDKLRVHRLDTRQMDFERSMIRMGWVPPLATMHALTDSLEIDRMCARIAGDKPTSPMISYRGDGVLNVGGGINLEMAIGIVMLLTKVKV